jgi:hypothetical protein
MAKKAGLSKEDCKDEEKRKAAVKRQIEKEGKPKPSVSTIINETDTNDMLNVDTLMSLNFFGAEMLSYGISRHYTRIHLSPSLQGLVGAWKSPPY